MNRNVEAHFSELPKVDINRSIFDRSMSHKTSFNVGDLIPFYVDEVLPGDTFKIKTAIVARLQTLLTPIMDNMYLDTYYFFVPNRLVWTHWKEFMGENNDSAWIPSAQYTIPKVIPPSSGWNVGTIADYFGIPTGVSYDSSTEWIQYPSALPFRAYALIAQEWFRDQNNSAPLNITFGDSNINGSNGSNYITDVEKGGAPFKAAKYHDYFTSCLPAPQKGPSVNFFGGPFDVNFAQNDPNVYVNHYAPVVPLNSSVGWNSSTSPFYLVDPSLDTNFAVNHKLTIASNLGDIGNRPLYRSDASDDRVPLIPANLWADLSKAGVNINEVRIAFQLQKFLEKDARAGTRYREVIKEHFGVTSSDARMMIPEYLGGHRIPISIHQVANQSQGDSDFLGDLGAMSNTFDVHEDFIRSFEEHGFVIGVCVARYDHSYPQGLERFWLRKNKTDFYFPVFANIGEQAVYKDEIYYGATAQALGVKPETIVFGYQEAWADYRYKPSRVSGEMRPGISNSLATWHLSDYYSQAPTLSDSWIREDKANVDRVLSVSSSVSNQIFADFYVQNIATRPMPIYSIPGLIDHH